MPNSAKRRWSSSYNHRETSLIWFISASYRGLVTQSYTSHFLPAQDSQSSERDWGTEEEVWVYGECESFLVFLSLWVAVWVLDLQGGNILVKWAHFWQLLHLLELLLTMISIRLEEIIIRIRFRLDFQLEVGRCLTLVGGLGLGVKVESRCLC